jgi:hypothetical protein
MQQQQQQKGMPLKADDATLKGVYANVMAASHTREEFILDFMLVHQPAGQLVSRIVISPGHLKRVIAALRENLNKFEEKFGAIEPAAEPEHQIGFVSENAS